MNEELKGKLKGLGLNDEQIGKLEAEGVMTEADMAMLSADEIKSTTGCGLLTAKKVAQAFAPTPVTAPAPDVVPEGEKPSDAEVKKAAQEWGMDPSMLGMVLMGSMASGAGMDFDMSTMMPIPAIVGGYNPKLRNINFLVMGQVERRLGTPIVVINDDGSVNTDQTIKYIMALEVGFEPAEDDVYYDEDGKPFEVIKVGVDAQSVYDADPVNPRRALQQNQMGTGRIIWSKAGLDVRQVVFFAATQTGELNPSDDAQLSWLRDHIKEGVNRMTLRGQYPKALSMYNEAARTGALPTLRVQLSRGARKSEVMPRRRFGKPTKDFSEEERPAEGTGFRNRGERNETF